MEFKLSVRSRFSVWVKEMAGRRGDDENLALDDDDDDDADGADIYHIIIMLIIITTTPHSLPILIESSSFVRHL